MTLDDETLRSTLKSIHGQLSTAEAEAIIDVARLAAAADKKSDVTEMSVLLSIKRVVAELAGEGEDMPLSAAMIDEQRLLDIGETLVPLGARELAFACAFLVMIQDLELTRDEKNLAVSLGEALVLEPARVEQLASQMEHLVQVARATAS